MIDLFVKRYYERKDDLEKVFQEKHPDAYIDIARAVVQIITDGEYGSIDPTRIHEINDGDYQGTLVYVIAGAGYQPDNYWYVKVGYGSCSGCDTLEAIRGYSDDKPSEREVKEYMTLALHIIQGLKAMGEDAV